MCLSFDFLSIKKIYQVAAIGGKFPRKGGNSVSSFLLLLPWQIAVIKGNFKYGVLVSTSGFLSQAN